MRSAMRRARSSGRARWARPAGDPRRGSGGRLGVPAAGPAHDPGAAAAHDGDHPEPAAGVRSCRRSAADACPAGSFGNGRACRLRRDALRRAVPRRRAWDGAPASAAGSVAVFAALGLGLALPFLLIAFVPALRRRLPEAGTVDGHAAAHPRDPMALTAAGCLWLLMAARRSDGAADRHCCGRRRRADAVRRRPDAAQGQAERLCGDACRAVAGGRRRDLGSCRERPAVASRVVAGAQAWSEERGRSELEAGPSGVRLFHRRLVPDLQGQRGGRDRPRRRSGTRSRRPA